MEQRPSGLGYDTRVSRLWSRAIPHDAIQRGLQGGAVGPGTGGDLDLGLLLDAVNMWVKVRA